MLAGPILLALCVLLDGDSGNIIADGLYLIVASITLIAPLASLILMIVVRVKYRNNTFGKILMWIYIVMGIISVISVFLLIFACASWLNDCSHGVW